MIMMCQCSFINFNDIITTMIRNVKGGGVACACMGDKGGVGTLILPIQFCYEPKMSLKKTLNLLGFFIRQLEARL